MKTKHINFISILCLTGNTVRISIYCFFSSLPGLMVLLRIDRNKETVFIDKHRLREGEKKVADLLAMQNKEEITFLHQTLYIYLIWWRNIKLKMKLMSLANKCSISSKRCDFITILIHKIIFNWCLTKAKFSSLINRFWEKIFIFNDKILIQNCYRRLMRFWKKIFILNWCVFVAEFSSSIDAFLWQNLYLSIFDFDDDLLTIWWDNNRLKKCDHILVDDE